MLDTVSADPETGFSREIQRGPQGGAGLTPAGAASLYAIAAERLMDEVECPSELAVRYLNSRHGRYIAEEARERWSEGAEPVAAIREAIHHHRLKLSPRDYARWFGAAVV